MKCDELKAIEFYPRNEVDNIIGCLRADKAQAEENAAFWKKKAEDAKVENEMLKSTKRALWLARAYIANIGKRLAISNRKKEMKEKVERFCRSKAEEYK